ncbi:hypothetical protein BECAL_01187 [Bellilinea caldifistulae]|uniref:Transmembrane protein n=1 Tax=Bellilinea caldifistulae TaxID=360411 RepID=A0A0P6XDI1_9CHLR|nr:hypothetical protein [Bellilinea caldifistulae]KPL77795.1 hypothetical protein AC812_02840 [Bellilinea caldifistulae]GAP10031.1 hypothetical protein BECAL_01187 [Bellilinea caldifistulae]
MNLSSSPNNWSLSKLFSGVRLRPGLLFGLIIFSALIAFEIFNYSTTDYALRDLLGDLRFAGIRWATILSIAFCGIDFAGIARLFTPEQGRDEPKEVWYLLGAWLLAATMNAVLTWWGVSMAIASHTVSSTAVIDQETLMNIVPVFVALMVWVIRILIIGSLSIAGERIFSTGSNRPVYSGTASRTSRPATIPTATASSAGLTGANLSPRRTVVPRPGLGSDGLASRPEPTYHNMQARSSLRTPGSSQNSGSTPTTLKL